MNVHPFYETIELDFDSVTVDAILEKGRRWLLGYGQDRGPTLRWITDKSVAFVPKYDTDVPWSLQNNANAWYCNKGHCLTSEPIDTDDSLRKRLHSALGGSAATATGGLEIQLYLVAPATPGRYLAHCPVQY
ncbi:hypothetical protein GSI_03519 [Ganoderma sinense ZZ0214-1]|uniref:Uncharacterized protein n=1 Tax=Ganoderma sinense ZZ0214-1 TaxID=1077348 RepID=A0A2G8SMD3_9APHY|nr:hypothetical protein GSI_03519 [Ganoderma sinense ZZ0214-1]